MPRELLCDDKALTVVTVRLPEWLRDILREEARKQRRSTSDYLRLMLMDLYEDQNPHREED